MALPSKLLIGYWHNFVNAAGYIKLKDVSSKWDVINVAFAETASDRCTVQFIPDQQTEAELKSDISYLKSLGKKVILSIGGQNATVSLPDNKSAQAFTTTVISIIDNYNFDGLDLDIETGISLASGDVDFKNPTTPMIVNLISATRAICNHYGTDFILSMAPEIAYVQGGITAYANNWGAYLPIIYGLRDKLTYIHVQHYNCGGNAALDGRNYNQGTADFEVAMAEMLLQGFPIAGNTNNIFPPLNQEQVAIGLPACSAAAPSGGYIAPLEMKKALDYIISGISYGGTYKLQYSSGYPLFRGIMAWSVNWDAYTNYEFSNNYRAYLDSVQPPPVQPPAVPASLTAIAVSTSQINVSWNSSTGAASYDLEIDGVVKSNVISPYSHIGLSAASPHTYRVKAKNAAGESTWSAAVNATTLSSGGQYSQWQAGTSYKVGDMVTYGGKIYKCRQAHTAITGWEPPNVPALWEVAG
jgi:chitinase